MAMEQNTPLIGADAVDGFRTIELAYAAYDALAAGKPIRIARRDV